MKAIWKGPEGVNADFGTVYDGKELNVTAEQLHKHGGNLEVGGPKQPKKEVKK